MSVSVKSFGKLALAALGSLQAVAEPQLLRAEQAFMQKKISASNLGEMMKFGRAFDLPKLKDRLTASAASAPAASGASASSGMNRACVGRRFDGSEPLFVRPEHVALYAKATQDENAAYSGDDAIAPPLFSVRLLKDALFKAVGDEELGADMVNLVHGEQDMEFLQPLRPWDVCATRVYIRGIEDKSTGQLLRVEEEVYAGGQLAVRVQASMFIRDPSKKKSGGNKGEAAPAEAPVEAPAEATSETPAETPAEAEAEVGENLGLSEEEVERIRLEARLEREALINSCYVAAAGRA